MIFLFSDVLVRAGGIETYLHALSRHLLNVGLPFRIVVAELEPCPMLDELSAANASIYRQRRLPGDRWLVRQRAMMLWLRRQLQPGDWVFCVRQPMSRLYPALVRLVHARRAKLAVSWMLTPEFIPPNGPDFNKAVAQTDAVISVSQAGVNQYAPVYGYQGKVHVVPYHNLPFFSEVSPQPPGPPWKIGYLGRLETHQKNLDCLLEAFAQVVRKRADVELHLYGGGPDQARLEQQASESGVRAQVYFHGLYDHRRDLSQIITNCHFFVYSSRYEGGPCFSLLELMQAGRFCVASNVGGIPDLYDGYPDCGTLVEPGDVAGLSTALLATVEKVAAGQINADTIRTRYLEAFEIHLAHKAWLSALGLSPKATLAL